MPALYELQRRQGALTGVTGILQDGGNKAGKAAQNYSQGLTTMELIAVVVGGVAVFSLAIWCMWYSCRRRALKREDAKAREAESEKDSRAFLARSGAPSPVGGRFEPSQVHLPQEPQHLSTQYQAPAQPFMQHYEAPSQATNGPQTMTNPYNTPGQRCSAAGYAL